MHRAGFPLILGILALLVLGANGAEERVLFEDDFGGLRSGPLFSVVGAHTEYHYLPEASPKGPWAVSCFSTDTPSQLAWEVRRRDGDAAIYQTYENRAKYTHPMLVAGDALWTDYTVAVRFAPESDRGACGLAFRYRNDRSYYFFGVSGKEAVLKRVRHERAFHVPDEIVLARARCAWEPGRWLEARVAVEGTRIRAWLPGVELIADDATFGAGKIALLSDVPAQYTLVRVSTSPAELERYEKRRRAQEEELARLEASNPKPVVWKKVKTEGFGVGRNLRFGDLDGDGPIDVLVGQVVHHGPKDRNSELSCLTALSFDGRKLWQLGTPDAWKDHLTNDVGFQIHDLDGDGRNEVIYCMNHELIVAEGATGRTLRKVPTPATNRPEANGPRILGDSLFFCDLRGQGRAGDLLIKDRYWQVWALDEQLRTLWTVECNTGHYPAAADVDGDGKDEVAIGYSLIDDDGRRLWTLDAALKEHADGVAIVRFREDLPHRILNAASDEGMLLIDLGGKILKHHRLGHVQNPTVADFRPDLPGLEMVSVNFWGNQGILHFYDAEGNVYHDCEPNQFGSMCLPVNWRGDGQEHFVHSPNVDLGGLFDGWGRRVVRFPEDGHPDQCNAVLDLTGDCRDEIVVWDPHAIWVYTQNDNPKQGKLYKPRRNARWNESNYQASVSLPGWSQ